MLQNISFRSTRAIHICIVFTTTLAIQYIFNYPRAAWTGFAVMMIYVGFDAGSTIRRTFHRFWGMALGLLLSYIIWFFGQIDYRILFFIVPIAVFFAYYSLGKLYMFPTIFTVTLTALGSDYYASDSYYPLWFFSDYFICTVIALIICVVFEYFIFKGRNLTNKFYFELQQDITRTLYDIFLLGCKKNINKSKLLKLTIHVNAKMLELNALLGNTQHSYQYTNYLTEELDFFFDSAKIVYQNIREILVLHPKVDLEKQKDTVHQIKKLFELSKMVKNAVAIDYIGEKA